jgi:formamidopyrimidine-DNA glycosylase
MPELPEIANRAKEIQRLLVGKTIADIDILQPKCVNIPAAKFKRSFTGAELLESVYHGKWIFTKTTKGHLLLNLGMGGDVFLVPKDKLPEKRQVVLFFDDGMALSIRFWWFGYVHHVAEGRLDQHTMTAKLGPNAVDLSKEEFREFLRGRKGAVKSFLLNQERIAGIGNAYIHDILFLARLHPLRRIDTLSEGEIDGLWQAIRDGLIPSLKKGGAWYERNLKGKPGRFVHDDIIVGYREGEPCPVCGGAIKKIKTGSNATFICPTCQPLKVPRKAAGEKPAKKAIAKKTTKKPARKKPAAKKIVKKAAPKKKAPRKTSTKKKPAKKTSTKRK